MTPALPLLGASALVAAATAAAGLLLMPRPNPRRERIAALLEAGRRSARVEADGTASALRNAPAAPAAPPSALAAALGKAGLTFADLGGTLQPWHVACGAAAAALACWLFLTMLLHLAAWMAGLAALTAGAGGAWLCFRTARVRRRARFLEYFPDAIDLVARAVRAGLPVIEAISAVARDVPGPAGEEFGEIANQLRIGVAFDEALWRTAEHVGLADFRIFAVSLSLQRETGGGLSETLSNLAGVIRRRKELRLKTKALSAEARASAMVISALPFVAGGGLAMTNPDYFGRFFSDPNGGYMLGAALAAITGGNLIMRVMIKRSVR
jgi:tight adherence protein B